MPQHRVHPRDAASLIVVRDRGTGTEVLLGRREPRSSFMPSVYVFPGGGVERADWRARCVSELAPHVSAQLHRRPGPARARALAVAALRETLEETGLAVGEHEGERFLPALAGLQYLGRAITPAQSPKRFHARFFLARASETSGELKGNGELLDLAFVPLEEAMKLPIISVTRLLLGEVEARLPGGADQGRRSLFIRFRGDRDVATVSQED